MPIINSFGALRQQRYSIAGTVPSGYWFASTSTKLTQGFNGSSNVKIKHINNTVWEYGNQFNSTITFRPYVIGFNNTTGAISYYKFLADQGIIGNYQSILGFEIDSSGNYHILTNNCKLIKYNSSDVFQFGYTFTDSVNIGTAVELIKDSSDYLYMLSRNAGNFILTKIDPTNYNVVWSYKVALSLSECSIIIDSADNIYVQTWYNIGTTNTIFKFNTSGTIVWQKTSTSFNTASLRFCLDTDTSNNLYIIKHITSAGANGLIVKIDSAGSTTYAKTITAPSAGSQYHGLIINENNDVVLLAQDTSGLNEYEYTVVVNNTATTVIHTERIGDGASPYLLYIDWAKGTGGIYLKAYQSSGVESDPSYVVKLPNSNDTSYNAPFSFNVTIDNGNVISTSGVFDTVTSSNPTISGSTVTFTTTTNTRSAATISSSSYTPSLGSTVPFGYNISL